MTRALGSFALVTLLLASGACSSGSETPPPAPPATAAPQATPPETASKGDTTPAPAALLPIAPAAGVGEGTHATLNFAMPGDWRSSPPSSNMRIAQAAIPGSGGDGELAVFWFGEGQGGDVESNLQRWVGQMSVTPGTNPKRETFEANGLRITWVDVQGSLSADAMGNTAGAERGGFRLFGAVVEGPGGPWFFKATGPEATLAPQREAFVALLQSAFVQPPRAGI